MLIRLDRDRLFRWLFAGLLIAEVAIVLLDALISESGWVSIGAVRRLVNITREDGVANFFSSVQALAVGAVLLLITLVVKGQSRGTSSRTFVGWGVITGLFIFLGIDDGTKLHERVGSTVKALVTDSSGEGSARILGDLYDVFPSYTWKLVFGPFIIVAGLFLIVFLMKELPTLRLKGLIVLAIGLFFVAEAMDFIEGMDNDIFDHIADLFFTTPGHRVHRQ